MTPPCRSDEGSLLKDPQLRVRCYRRARLGCNAVPRAFKWRICPRKEPYMADAWIIDAVRTPRGKGKKETGALSHVHPQELLAQALQALTARNDFDARDVEDLVAGCVSEAGEQGGCIARMAVLAAGWPI